MPLRPEDSLSQVVSFFWGKEFLLKNHKQLDFRVEAFGLLQGRRTLTSEEQIDKAQKKAVSGKPSALSLPLVRRA
jgi:hypothetical protein